MKIGLDEPKGVDDLKKSYTVLDDAEMHPKTDCPSTDDWLSVETDGVKRWITCSQCHETWLFPLGEIQR